MKKEFPKKLWKKFPKKAPEDLHENFSKVLRIKFEASNIENAEGIPKVTVTT